MASENESDGWSCSCSTPQYSANRSIRKQHQTTSLDRGKLPRFFSGTIWAPPCTLPKNTSRDNNKKLPKETNPRAPKHVFGAQNEAKIVKNRSPAAFQQQSGSKQGPEVKKHPTLHVAPRPVWDPFWVFVGNHFEDFSGTPFFRFLSKQVPKMQPKRGPFLRRWT